MIKIIIRIGTSDKDKIEDFYQDLGSGLGYVYQNKIRVWMYIKSESVLEPQIMMRMRTS